MTLPIQNIIPTRKPSQRIKLFLLDLLFPNRCPFCSKFIEYDHLACDECLSQVELSVGYCQKCGKHNCQCHRGLAYSGCESIILYSGISKRGIVCLKDNKGVSLAELFSYPLAEKLVKVGIANKIDVVTAVATERSKRRKRGYNPAEIIAKAVAERIEKPCCFKLIQKPENNHSSQHSLSYGERLENAKSLYKVGENAPDIKGKTVLLCDDVVTTGSTLHECSKLLLEMGAEQVFCAVIASTPFEAQNNEK